MSDLVPVSLADLVRTTAAIADVWAEVVARWDASHRTAATREAYRGDVSKFLAWLGDHTDRHPLSVRWVDVAAWAEYMRDGEKCDASCPCSLRRTGQEPAPAAPTTQARRIAAVSSLYRYAVKVGAIDRNPADPALVDRPPTGPDHVKLTPSLTPSEVARLLVAASGPQDRALVLLLSCTGMRVSEALSLDLDGVATERGHTVVTVTGKGGKVNTAPIVPRLAVEVDAIRQERTTGPLFTAEHGGRMTRQGAARVLTRLGHRAGLGKPITPHMLRAAAITNALADGVSLDRVQRMARHSDPRTTMRYNRAADDIESHPAYRLADGITSALAS